MSGKLKAALDGLIIGSGVDDKTQTLAWKLMEPQS